ASLYSSRLGATIPHDLPVQAALAAKGSVGSALVAAQSLVRAGLAIPGHQLAVAATGAFLHSLRGGCTVAGVVALVGAAFAVVFRPARPGLTTLRPAPALDGQGGAASLEPGQAV